MVITRIRRFDAVDGIGGGTGVCGAGAAPDSRAFGVDTSPAALCSVFWGTGAVPVTRACGADTSPDAL